MRKLLFVAALAVAPVLTLAKTLPADVKGAELKDGKILLPKHAMLPINPEGAKIYLRGHKAPWGFMLGSKDCLTSSSAAAQGNYPVFMHDGKKLVQVGCAHDDKVPTA
ncbi:MAG: hypothetical protein K0S08_1856 [Gammaproteobacteria bacterium]|jgi:hypothetical protein|nr:hypothetical protein [Gammaproteobacteria bacterium]